MSGLTLIVSAFFAVGFSASLISNVIRFKMTVGPHEVKNLFFIRVVSILLILFSVAEIVIGSTIYEFLSNVHLGSWWAAICTLVVGFIGCVAISRSVLIGTCAMSVVALIIAVVGAVIDCIATTVFQDQTGCVNTETNREWGTRVGRYHADECAIQYILSSNQDDNQYYPYTLSYYNYYNESLSHYYSNHLYNYYYNHPYNSPYVNQSNQLPTFYYYMLLQSPSNHQSYFYNYYYYNMEYNFYYNHPYYFMNHYGFYQPHQCVCSDGSACYGYDLTTGQDCGSIPTTYAGLLEISTALLSVLCVLSLLLLVLTGFGLCSAPSSSSSAAGTHKVVAGGEESQEGVQLSQNKQRQEQGQVPLFMVTPVEIQEGGGSLPPGATVVMMVMPPSGAGSSPINYNSSRRSSRRPSQLPTVLETD